MPQVAVLRDLCPVGAIEAQVCEYADLWHPANDFKLTTTSFPAGVSGDQAELRLAAHPAGDPDVLLLRVFEVIEILLQR